MSDSGPDGTGFTLWHNRVRSSVIYTDSLFRLFFHCVSLAAFEDRVVTLKVGNGTVRQKLRRGQLIYGRVRWAEELGIPESTLNGRMTKLKDNGSIRIEANSNYSVVTVVNYDVYQTVQTARRQVKPRNGQHLTDTLPAPQRHLTDTTKELKFSSNELGRERRAQKSSKASAVRTWGVESLTIPLSLQSADVTSALADWLNYKGPAAYNSEQGPRYLNAQIEKYATVGPQALIDDIVEAIARKWDGFYFPKKFKETHGDGSDPQRTKPNSSARIHSDAPRKPLKVHTNASAGE